MSNQEHWRKLSVEDEDMLIKRYPNEFSRDSTELICGVSFALWNANPKCNHLIISKLSGCKCLKCNGWYCA